MIKRGPTLALPVLMLSAMASVQAAEPPPFGTDHDDPRTAYPALSQPDDGACVVKVLQHGFNSFDPARATLDAAKQCPGPWSRAVLRIDGKVKGRQYDRIGHVTVGGVTVFRTSTPEPSREGISWQVEKDVSAYAALFAKPQPVEMVVGNVVNDTYTGIFDIALTLRFYPVDARHAVAMHADEVHALDGLHGEGTDTAGRFTIPDNARQLVAEVYATGSGGGCEEFWYFATPQDGYWCHSTQGPYREVQVLVDGKEAGIAAAYPHIYTGGWSNPYLWYLIPAPRAFDIHPIRFDLTPFIGLVNDGKPHELRFRVPGLPPDKEGWKLMPSVHVWRDAGSTRTRGELLEATLSERKLDNPVGKQGALDRLQHAGERSFRSRGVLETSLGRIETTVERKITSQVDHRWGSKDDDDDMLRGDWTDTATVTRRKGDAVLDARTVAQRFGLDGSIQVQGEKEGQRLTTTLEIHDNSQTRSREGTAAEQVARRDDRFEGSASYNTQAPREKRNATTRSRQAFTSITPDGRCFHREIATVNGRFVTDSDGCPPPAARP